jgi:ankyrin repeat protein
LGDRVEFFLSRGADVNALDELGNMPLHYAAGEGHKEVVRTLVAHGADVNAVNEYRATPLSKLTLGASRWAQEYTCEKYAVGRLGTFSETAELLIASGSAVDQVGGRGTLLHAAAQSRYVDAAKVLLAHGADISAQDKYGHTPCSRARESLYRTTSMLRMRRECAAMDDRFGTHDADASVKDRRQEVSALEAEVAARQQVVELLCDGVERR